MATTPSGPAMSKRCMATSKSFSRGIARVLQSTLNAFLPRCCLQISSIQHAAPPRWAIRHGGDCWTVMISWQLKRSQSIAGLWSRRPAMEFWQPLMDRAVRFAALWHSEPPPSRLGLPLRAGLHTGEIEIRGRDIGGIAVHAAARVMAQSQPSEVLVSRVVTDLVAGAGLKFAERGSHELKGLPGRWDLFAASA